MQLGMRLAKKSLGILILLGLNQLTIADGFILKSDDISGQLSPDQVFSGFGCDGQNLSPQLRWDNAPEGTKSFALTVYDPDAPTGSGFWHWVIFDIPQSTNSLNRNAGSLDKSLAPKSSIQSTTSFGTKGYGGACPPKGDKPHQYIFTVHALKVEKLGVDANTTPEMVGFNLGQNTLAKATLVAYYQR